MKNNVNRFIIASSWMIALVLGREHQQQLNEAREKWAAINTQKYHYEYLTTIQSDNGGVTPQVESRFGIQVTQNRVTNVVGIPFIEVPDELAATAITIDQMFDFIQAAIDDSSRQFPTIDVEYDDFYGYPSHVAVIYNNDPPVSAAPGILSNEATTTNTTSSISIVSPNRLVGSIDKFVPTSYRLDQIAESKEQWESYEYLNYDMIYQRRVNLPPPASSLVKIQVRDGVVSNVLLVTPSSDQDGEYIEGEDVTSDFGNSHTEPPTMMDLFDMVTSALTNQHPINIDIGYEFPYRYLTDVDIDYDYDTDNELKFVVSKITLFHQNRLDEAVALWQTHFTNNDDYSFGFQRSCFCIQSMQLPFWITVESGAVTSVKTRPSAAATSQQGFEDGSIPASIPTIVDLFDTIQQAIDTDASRIAVTYDKTYGYPLKIFIDPQDEVGNDEYDVVIDGFAPVSLWKNELEDAQTAWESQCFTSYSFYLEQQCMTAACISLYDPKLIEVVDGQVISVNGQTANNVDEFDDIPTVEKIFERLNKALFEEKAFAVHSSYDETLGWPINVMIEYDEMLPDVKYSVVLSELVGGDVGDDCGAESNGDEEGSEEGNEGTVESSSDNGEEEGVELLIPEGPEEVSSGSSFGYFGLVVSMFSASFGATMLLL